MVPGLHDLDPEYRWPHRTAAVLYCYLLFCTLLLLEGMARYAGQLLAPAEVYASQLLAPKEVYKGQLLAPKEGYKGQLLAPVEGYAGQLLAPSEE